jgi:hypothetical protein
MNLNGDAREDLFLLNRATGQWYWAISGPGGGFSYPQTGTWASDWQLYPGDFSGDGLTDLILHRPATGDYFVAITAWFGFTYTRGGWTPGFAPTVMDLDANNRADLFLYDRNTGQWFEHLSDGLGHFVNVGSGGWNPGWDLYPTDFNNDLRADLLLYNPVTGQYFQAWNFGLGGFMYFSGFWNTGLTIVTGRPR